MNLRLIGAPTIKDVTRDMVDASSIHSHLVAVPEDRLFHQNCASFHMRSGTCFVDLRSYCYVCGCHRREHAKCSPEGNQVEDVVAALSM